jgi:hypothetical protein
VSSADGAADESQTPTQGDTNVFISIPWTAAEKASMRGYGRGDRGYLTGLRSTHPGWLQRHQAPRLLMDDLNTVLAIVFTSVNLVVWPLSWWLAKHP